MNVRDAIAASRNLAAEFDSEVNGIEFPASDRARLAAALLDQAHEHHKAIHTLLDADLRGSAFSLIRILFETMIRGCWLFRCATDEQVTEFQSDVLDLPFGKLIEALEGVYDGGSGLLSSVKKHYWSALCSFAHGGYLQVVRRITPESISPSYSDGEVLEVAAFADFCFFLSCIEAMNICNRPELAEHRQQRRQSTLPRE
jgi:hypothetical protein